MILSLREARMLHRLAGEGTTHLRDSMTASDWRLAQVVRGKVEDEITELEARDRLTEAELELRGALDRLWLEAGEPSTRQMSRQIRVNGEPRSNMTWHYALRCNPVPALSTLRALVSYLDGDVERFEDLWFRAKGKTSYI